MASGLEGIRLPNRIADATATLKTCGARATNKLAVLECPWCKTSLEKVKEIKAHLPILVTGR